MLTTCHTLRDLVPGVAQIITASLDVQKIPTQYDNFSIFKITLNNCAGKMDKNIHTKLRTGILCGIDTFLGKQNLVARILELEYYCVVQRYNIL